MRRLCATMLGMARRTVDVAVIIPDASPVLTLARIGRTDLLGSFTVPVRDCCPKGWNWSRKSTPGSPRRWRRLRKSG